MVDKGFRRPGYVTPRLERRRLPSLATLLATGLKHRPMEALPAGWLDATARAAVGFAGRPTSGAGLASASATVLAKGVLHHMAIFKLKVLAIHEAKYALVG